MWFIFAIMTPTSYQFLQFVFWTFPSLVKDVRNFEKVATQAFRQKTKVQFLQDCLRQQVVPRSLRWVLRVDPDSPFSAASRSCLQDAVRKAKLECDVYFYKLRCIERFLRSHIGDVFLWNQLHHVLKTTAKLRATGDKDRLESLLIRLIEVSPWAKFSLTSNVVNLSSITLTKYQTELLGLGLNFALPHGRKDFVDFVHGLHSNKVDSPQFSFLSMSLGNILDDLFSLGSYLPDRYLKALSELKHMRNIHISKADKGGKIVILDVLNYKSKMLELLRDTNTYQPVKSNPLAKMQREFNAGLSKLIADFPEHNSFINQYKSKLPSLPYAYGLPKIHKDNVPLRPIISNCGAPSYYLAKYLAKTLSASLGCFSDSHLRHSGDLLSRLKPLVPGDKKFISFDAQSLFTNVPIAPTLDFLKNELPKLSLKLPVSVNCFIRLIELCTNNSYFEFDGTFYLQIFGMAMGSPLSPVLANIFLEYVERDLLPSFPGVPPSFWVRYVDDVLALVSPDFDLEKFLSYINSLYPTLKFSYEWETGGVIPFLDVLIHNCFSSLKFRVFRKPTSSDSYIHYFSCHAHSTKIAVAQGLFLRAFRLCDSEFLNEEILYIKNCFAHLAYPEHLVNKALSKARASFFVPGPKSSFKTDNCLIIPYVPSVQKNWQTFSRGQNKVIFKYNNKLSHNLVHNNLKAPKAGVYVIPCDSCDQIYVGETGRDLDTRVKEHIRDVENRKMSSAPFCHYLEQGHRLKFDQTKLIYPCSKTVNRRIVESAVIVQNSKSCINQNQGFFPHNSVISCFISKSINFCSL